MVADFEIRGGEDLRRISRELRRMDERELRKLRASAKPLVPLVRASIMRIPSKSSGKTGLRKAMARAVTLKVRTTGRDAGVSIRVDGRKMPPGKGALPAYMEGRKSPWRHPVYGNTDTWVTQRSHPYFYRIAVPYGRRAKSAIAKVARGISRDIT